MLPLIPPVGSEDETPRDGPFSTLTEWHAAILGAVAGGTALFTGQHWILAAVTAGALGVAGKKRQGKDNTVPAFGEIKKEPWYALGGMAAGALAIEYGPEIYNFVTGLL